MATQGIPYRVRSCKQCGCEFSYEVKRGSDRLFCGAQCARTNHKHTRALLPRQTCKVEGCGDDAVRIKVRLCEKHHARWVRKGHTSLKAPKPTLVHTGGYILQRAPDHPLTQRHTGNMEYQHRVVFYDAHGEGPFSCHVCAAQVEWATMHVDHLNDDPSDNRLENLAPACPLCNQKRGRWKMVRTRRANGVQFTYRGETMVAGQWAARLGITRAAFLFRHKAKWPASKMFTEGRGRFGPQRGAISRPRASKAGG